MRTISLVHLLYTICKNSEKSWYIYYMRPSTLPYEVTVNWLFFFESRGFWVGGRRSDGCPVCRLRLPDARIRKSLSTWPLHSNSQKTLHSTYTGAVVGILLLICGVYPVVCILLLRLYTVHTLGHCLLRLFDRNKHGGGHWHFFFFPVDKNKHVGGLWRWSLLLLTELNTWADSGRRTKDNGTTTVHPFTSPFKKHEQHEPFKAHLGFTLHAPVLQLRVLREHIL